MDNLLCAVGYDGRVVFLQEFPDDEEHGGLQKMLDELSSDCGCSSFAEPPGLYLASLTIEAVEEVVYLNIDKLTPYLLTEELTSLR